MSVGASSLEKYINDKGPEYIIVLKGWLESMFDVECLIFVRKCDVLFCFTDV